MHKIQKRLHKYTNKANICAYKKEICNVTIVKTYTTFFIERVEKICYDTRKHEYRRVRRRGKRQVKKKKLLLMGICLVVLFTGCAQQGNQGIIEETVGTDTSNGRPGILKSSVAVGENSNLFYIPNDYIEENLMQDFRIFEEQLLLSYYTYEEGRDADILHLRLLGLDTGEVLCETELPTTNSYSVTIQVCKEQIVVSDAQNSVIYVLDENLQEKKKYEAVGNVIYVNPSVTEAYCFTSTEGLHIFNLDNKQEKILFENTSELSVYDRSENAISIRYIDLSTVGKLECYAGLNLETGEIERFELNESFSGLQYQDGMWIGQILSKNQMYFLGTQEEPYQFQCEEEYARVQFLGNPARMLIMTTDQDGTQKMELYDTDGTFLSSCSYDAEDGSMGEQPIWLERAGGILFRMIDDTGHDQLYFWDVSKEIKGSDLELQSYKQEVVAGEVLEAEYYERAKQLSEEYGVTIKIAEQCSKEYSDKIAEQECDPVKIAEGLTILEKVFSAYPNGFFDQLYYGVYRTLEINLMGEIWNKEEVEGYVPDAFVQHENGTITMVLNLNDTPEILKQNFYHETSHIIDKVLEHNAFYREDAVYSEEQWWTLNPDEFVELNPEYGGYYESYEIMPMEYYQEMFTPYFVSDYGKTFSTEDRAMIFENAMIGNADLFTGNASEAFREKLEYYCESIRDCFDTAGWPEYTTWETIFEFSYSAI